MLAACRRLESFAGSIPAASTRIAPLDRQFVESERVTHADSGFAVLSAVCWRSSIPNLRSAAKPSSYDASALAISMPPVRRAKPRSRTLRKLDSIPNRERNGRFLEALRRRGTLLHFAIGGTISSAATSVRSSSFCARQQAAERGVGELAYVTAPTARGRGIARNAGSTP
jgi:hypothetical protein